jgi:hypothetical protein
MIEHRDVGLDAAFMDEPGEVLSRAVCGVGRQSLRVEAEALLGALDHGHRGPDFGLTDSPAGFDVDDHGMVEINQIVGRIGEEGMAFVRACPLGGRIRSGDELRFDRTGRASGCIIERVEILAHRPARRRHRFPIHPFGRAGRALLVGIRLDQAGICRETLTTNEPFRYAAGDGCLEPFTQQIAVAEVAVTVLRETRVIGHVSFEAEPAKPAIGQIEMDLLAQEPHGTDAHAVADDQHPDQQLRIDRGPTRFAVIGTQMLAEGGEIHDPVNRAQHMLCRHVPFEVEAVEQGVLCHRPLAHHRLSPEGAGRLNQIGSARSTAFFNKIRYVQSMAWMENTA